MQRWTEARDESDRVVWVRDDAPKGCPACGKADALDCVDGKWIDEGRKEYWECGCGASWVQFTVETPSSWDRDSLELPEDHPAALDCAQRTQAGEPCPTTCPVCWGEA